MDPRLGRALLLLVLIALWSGCSTDEPLAPTDSTGEFTPPASTSPLLIGPIPGLTTAWHPAPAEFALPRAVTVVQFKCPAAQGATVTWNGATETSRTDAYSLAQCDISQATGLHVVEVTVVPPATGGEGTRDRDGTRPRIAESDGVVSSSCEFSVFDGAANEIHVRAVELTPAGTVPDENASQAVRMQLLLGGGRSVAPVKNLGFGRYRTASGTTVRVVATTDHPGVTPRHAPVLEWRSGGRSGLVGGEEHITLPLEPGLRHVSIGPPGSARELSVDTYGASISVDSGRIVPGKPVVFRVVTDPPGFEEEVVWVSATLFGTAQPTVGRGDKFQVTFEKPWPTTSDGMLCLGVRAGNTSYVVENPPPSFEDDMVRLHDDMDELVDGLGEYVCCLTDSLAKQQLYESINNLTIARVKVATAISTFQSLPGLVRTAINIAYGDVAADLQQELVVLETSIAELNAQPTCGAPTDTAAVTQIAALCDVLCSIGNVLLTIGGILTVLGGILATIPGAQAVGLIIGAVGLLLVIVGAALVIIGQNLGCC